MPSGPLQVLADVARRWSLASGVVALVLGGAAVVGLVFQSATLADSDTRNALMDTVLGIERLEAELTAEVDRVRGDSFAEFIAERELLSGAKRLEASLAAAAGRLTSLPERFRGELAVLVGDHFAALRERLRRLRLDLVDIWDLRKTMFRAMDDLVRAPDIEYDLYAAVVETVALVHGHAQEEVLPTAENIAVGLERVRNTAANLAPGTVALASEFATHVETLAERRVAVQGKLEEIDTSAQERRQDVHRLVDELQAEWWEAAKPPAWIVLVLTLALLLSAVGTWTALTGRYRDTRNSPPTDTRFDATAAIVSRVSAERVSAAAREIRQQVSSLRLIPQYSSGAGTSGAKAVQSFQALGSSIERTAAGLARLAVTAMPARPGEVVGLAQSVARMISRARKEAGGDVGFEVSTCDARVWSSSDDVGLMLGNVLANAAEAHDGGTRTSLVRVSIEVDSDRAEAAVVVTDNGPGMTKRVQDRAFDLYFTTKPSRLGAGLTVTRQVAANWGGSASISQSGGSGATIRISLPLATDDDPQAEIRSLISPVRSLARALANRVLRAWQFMRRGLMRGWRRFASGG